MEGLCAHCFTAGCCYSILSILLVASSITTAHPSLNRQTTCRTSRDLATADRRQEGRYSSVCSYSLWLENRQVEELMSSGDPGQTLCTEIFYLTSPSITSTRSKGLTIALRQGSQEEDLVSYMREVREDDPSIKVLLSVEGESVEALASSPRRQKEFAWQAVSFLNHYGLDGLALHLHPTVRYPHMSHLLRAVRIAFERDGRRSANHRLMLSVVTSPQAQGDLHPQWNLPEINRQVDFINLENSCLDNSAQLQIDHVGSAARQWLDTGISPYKLVISLPEVTRDNQVASSTRHQPDLALHDTNMVEETVGTHAYKEIEKLKKRRKRQAEDDGKEEEKQEKEEEKVEEEEEGEEKEEEGEETDGSGGEEEDIPVGIRVAEVKSDADKDEDDDQSGDGEAKIEEIKNVVAEDDLPVSIRIAEADGDDESSGDTEEQEDEKEEEKEDEKEAEKEAEKTRVSESETEALTADKKVEIEDVPEGIRVASDVSNEVTQIVIGGGMGEDRGSGDEDEGEDEKEEEKEEKKGEITKLEREDTEEDDVPESIQKAPETAAGPTPVKTSPRPSFLDLFIQIPIYNEKNERIGSRFVYKPRDLLRPFVVNEVRFRRAVADSDDVRFRRSVENNEVIDRKENRGKEKKLEKHVQQRQSVVMRALLSDTADNPDDTLPGDEGFLEVKSRKH